MGGKAFARHNPPLPTPRLSTDIYTILRDRYIAILSTLFTHVASPTEAPSKLDHGDIDILVYGPRPDKLPLQSDNSSKPLAPSQIHLNQINAVKQLLSPAASIYACGSLNLALPHPDLANIYIQLDVSIVPTLAQWRWLLFTHSHGDFFSLLGTSLRRVGLVGTDKGFFARDIDIEPHDRKKCLVPLTDDPAKVIDFLGLDSKYWIPRNSTRGDDTTSSAVVQFKDTTELFRAIAGMRFFDVGAYVKKDLKGNDKIRVGTRDAFRTFVDDFLPSLVEEEGRIETSAEEEEKGVRRAEVFQEALTHWNKFDEWVQMKRAWDYDRIEALTRRSAKEEKRYATLEEDQYIKSWLEWCGYTTIQIK